MITAGTAVEVTTATGEQVRMRALGRPVRGRDFPVLWVCTEEEYERARQAGGDIRGMPWPLDAVVDPQA